MMTTPYATNQTRLFVIGTVPPSMLNSLVTQYVASLEHHYHTTAQLMEYGRDALIKAPYNALLIGGGVDVETRNSLILAVEKVSQRKSKDLPIIGVMTEAQNFDSKWVPIPPTPTVADIAQAFRIPPRTSPARSIAVVSTKGGVGKSGVASSIAVTLAKMKKADGSPYKVALIDDDRMTRSVRIVMGIPDGAPNTASLVQKISASGGIVTAQLVEEHLVQAHGVYCMAGPESVITNYPVDLTLARDILALMGIELGFDYIIIDAPPDFLQASNFTYSILENGSNMPVPPLALIPIVPETALLNSARDTLQALKHFGMPTNRIFPVVNCTDTGHEPADLQDNGVLWRDPSAIIPYMTMARYVGDKKRPVVCEEDASGFTRMWRKFMYGEESVQDVRDAYGRLAANIIANTKEIQNGIA